MVALYITSSASGSGKTTLCAGLGKHLFSSGHRVGFFKPVITANNEKDSDTTFLKHIFGLEETQHILAPIFRDEVSLKNSLKEAYAKVTTSKDVVIIEGVFGQSDSSSDLVATLEAKVIVIADYAQELLPVIDTSRRFGEQLLGIVVNKVPGSRLGRVRDEVSHLLEPAGIKILGILPEDRSLLALTIGELTEQIHGELLRGSEKSAELVENIMLGANVLDNTMNAGPLYFRRKANKATILKSERPDMQMAALESPTTCLVLTGNTSIKEVVLAQAKKKNVPVILARDDVPLVVTQIEEALGKSRFCQENKLPRLTEIMQEYFDFTTIERGLGLSL